MGQSFEFCLFDVDAGNQLNGSYMRVAAPSSPISLYTLYFIDVYTLYFILYRWGSAFLPHIRRLFSLPRSFVVPALYNSGSN